MENEEPRLDPLDLRPREATRDTCLGKIRTWDDLERIEVAFLSLAVVSLLGALGLTLYNVATSQGDDLTFAVVLSINIGFCIYYVINGVFSERPFEVSILIVGSGILIVYITVNFASVATTHLNIVKLVRLILIWVFGPIDVALGIVITRRYFQSNNLIFRTVGANLELQGACKTLYFTSALLKFDLQLAVSMVILFLRFDKIGEPIEFREQLALAVGIPFTVIWMIIGFGCMRFEKRPLVWIFLATSVLEPAYACYVIKRAVDHIDDISKTSVALSSVTFATAIATIAIRITVCVSMILVYRNFGRGLKQKVYQGTSHEELYGRSRKSSIDEGSTVVDPAV